MAQWGNQDQANSAPKYTTNATTGESGIEEFGNTVFGVDKTEAALISGPASPGWVRVTTGTGGRAGRKTYETLVAFKGIQGDGDDNAEFPNETVENTVAPEISGTVQVGETLTTTNGTWVADTPPASYTYQWFADGVAIAGATANTFLLTVAEDGAMITVSVVATSTEYISDPATSVAVGPVIPA